MKGFAMVPTHVLRNRALPASARLLYGVILTYAWGENPCKATNDTLCADCGIGRTALYDAIRALKSGELIEVTVIGKQREIRPTLTGGVRIPDADWDSASAIPESGIRTQVTEVDEGEENQVPLSSEVPHGTASPHEHEQASSADHDSVPVAPLSRYEPPAEGEQDTRTPGEQFAASLCRALARRIHDNDPKAKLPAAFHWPTPDHLDVQVGHPSAKPWLDAMRLLIDRDERDPDEVGQVLQWCQHDEFWKGNVLSAPTFRERYPRLRHAWDRSRTRPAAGTALGGQSTSTVDLLQRVGRSFGSAGAARGTETDLRRRAGGR